MSTDFIFLRPWWLLALLLVPALFILQRARRGERNAWQQAVDPHLLPHLIETRGNDPASLRSWLIPLGAAIAIVALAGPSWQQQKTPLWQLKAPLVIAMDLSSAMLAADLAPSRLQQARAKISALLKQRRGGEVGLVAWAGDAFTAAPMTRDAATAQVVVDSLAPDLMPVDGQRADRGIEHAVSIMKSAGFEHGDILLVTDHADAQAEAAAAQARAQGFRVSALGVGTASGAPMTSASGFVSDARGQVQLARLDLGSLRALAARGGGTAVALTVDGSDLDALGVLDPQGPATQATSPGGAGMDGKGAANAATTVQRSDDGYWLVLLLLPLALLGFRRQQPLALLPLMLTLGVLWHPVPAEAAAPVRTASATASAPTQVSPPAAPSAWASAWDGLWQRKDQRARAALEAGDLAQARALAPDPSLRGAAAYRSKDWSAAAQDFAAGDSADAQYNRGNALAMAGDYKKALAAYDKALAQEPDMADALANRKAVEDMLKQPPPKQDQQDKQSQDKADEGKQGENQQDQDKQDQKPQGQDKSDQDQQADSQQDQPGENQQGQNQQDKNEADQHQQDQSSQSTNQSSKPADSSAADQSGSDKKTQSPEAKPAPSEDARREADAAAKREMQQALDRQSRNDQAGQPEQPAIALSPGERENAERQQALQQWLRRVPDDPGGLLRWKFAIEYQRRQEKGEAP